MEQTIIIGLLVVVGVGILYLSLKNLLLNIIEKSEDQHSKRKQEIDSGVNEMLTSNRKQLDLIVKQLKEQLKGSQDEVKSLQQQNAAIRQHLEHTTAMTEKLHVSTEGLKNLLSNNRLRGDWGEQVAEDLLLGAGFTENINYLKQTTMEEGRPDFTVLLPDGTKLNVDAKFPFNDLVSYQESNDEADKKRHLSSFERAVKEKIKEITSKDYIDPEARTVDFVVMFIPNEMIFSFIYEKLPQMVSYCNERKVVMTGPFGFTAMLRLVLQAHKNFHYEQGLHDIVQLIEKFQGEYDKFGETLGRVGRQLDSAQKAFREVEGTRHRSLTRVVEKISEHSSRSKMINKESETIKIEKGEE